MAIATCYMLKALKKQRTNANFRMICSLASRTLMGQIPVRWTINTKRTAIIVVDMQGVFCNRDGAVYIPDAMKVVDPILRILDAGRKADIPIIYLRHVVRGDGSDTGRMRDLYPGVDAILDRSLPSVDIIEPLKPLPGDIVVDKLFFTANTRSLSCPTLVPPSLIPTWGGAR